MEYFDNSCRQIASTWHTGHRHSFQRGFRLWRLSVFYPAFPLCKAAQRGQRCMCSFTDAYTSMSFAAKTVFDGSAHKKLLGPYLNWRIRWSICLRHSRRLWTQYCGDEVYLSAAQLTLQGFLCRGTSLGDQASAPYFILSVRSHGFQLKLSIDFRSYIYHKERPTVTYFKFWN